MLEWLWSAIDWFRGLFWKEEMEVTLVGLQNSGKTTLVNVLTSGQFTEDMVPTIGFNMRKIRKGRVIMKIWDLGGQPRFRSMWERYCRGVNAIVFVVDSADASKFDAAQDQLQQLLSKPQLAGIPVLVLGNKNDLPNAIGVESLISRLGLSLVTTQEVSCYSISAKNSTNIDITLQWLIKHAKAPPTAPQRPILANSSSSQALSAETLFPTTTPEPTTTQQEPDQRTTAQVAVDPGPQTEVHNAIVAPQASTSVASE